MTQTLKNGKLMRGEDHPTATITEHDVRMIRKLYADGVAVATLAKRYDMTPSSVYLIKNRRRWSHVR